MRNTIQRLKLDSNSYRCLTATGSKFDGKFVDEEGQVINRKIVGDDQMFTSIQTKSSKVVDLKFCTKQTLRNCRLMSKS